jgi:hypothetical protein
MKAMSPQTPSKNTAKAQLWDMVVTASGMPVLLELRNGFLI